MRVQQLPEQATRSFQALAKIDLLFFTRWMFLQRRGYKWLMSPHHRIICDALTRVFEGKCKRLIINIPPRYSKTEIAVINFMAWALGQCPDAEFIHTSYSGRLAANNAWQARELVQSEQYRHIFPETQLRTDSSARDEWRTTAGGCVYAVGAGGTITGYGAGKHRPGFGGCFPYEQLVQTEQGPVAIGDIVTKKLRIRVWSYNEITREAELKPIDTFWTNPGNDIVKVHLKNGESFKCTPDHKVLTSSGWTQAIDLSESLDLVNGESGFFSGLHPRFCRVDGYVYHLLRMLWLALPASIRESVGNASPCLSGFDLTHYTRDNAVTSGYLPGTSFAGEYFDNLFSGEFCPGSHFKQWKGSVLDGILHIVGLASPCEVFESIVSALSVEVSSFISRIRSFTDECLKDKRGDISQSYLSKNREIDAEITLPVFAGFDIPQRGCSPDVSRAGNFIEPESVRNNSPLFVERFGHVDTTFCLEVRDNHNFILSQCGAIVKNCIIIDDPHKADEARSDVMRNNVLEWFQNTLESRKNSPETPIILIMQRLHEEDLAGWLLAGGNGEEWEHICLPALQEDGLALWPAKHSVDDLRRMQTASPYNFSGQYQQRPSPAEGGIFKPDQIQVVDAIPAGNIKWVRGWDLASTTDGDWTVGVRLGKLADGRFIVADVCRVRVGPDQRDAAIQNTAALDGRSTKISLPQDPGQAGKTQVLYLSRALAGYSVTSSPESGDKVTRAEPAAAQVNVGNVMMLRGDWNNQFIQELRMFPNGTFDDQVDAFSRAFMELIGARKGFFTR